MSEILCPQCESPLGAEANECSECGFILRRICRRCGSETKEGQAKCMSCGASLLCPVCGEILESDHCENCDHQEEPDPLEEEFDIGVELMEEHEFEGAIDSFTKYLVRCEKGIERNSAVTNRAYCFFALGKFTDAREDFSAAIEHTPGDTALRFHRGRCRYAAGDALGAADDFATVLEIDPEYIEAYFYRGLSLIELGKDAEAIAAFTSLLGCDPGNELALYNRGRCFQLTEKYLEAIEDYSSFFSVSGEDADAYFHRSECLIALKRPREALADLVRARDLGSDKAAETIQMLAEKIRK